MQGPTHGNLFSGMTRNSYPVDSTTEKLNEHLDSEAGMRESPFMGNHVVTTVRNLKRLK